MTSKPTRSIEREFLIDAPPEQVWDTFTRASEIVNWFAVRAESKPGVGGHISLFWDMEDLEPNRCVITDWQPGQYLRMTWRDAPGGEQELPVEVWLTRKDGGTLLKLVHSGWLTDADWDEEFDAHGRGWSYELRSLKYYLENKLGRTRQFVMRRFPVAGSLDEAWNRVVGKSGAFGLAMQPLAEGAEVILDLPGGISSAGELFFATEGRDFVTTASVLQGGLFRIALEMVSGVPEIWVWAFSWHMSEDEIRAIALPIYDAIATRLGGD